MKNKSSKNDSSRKTAEEIIEAIKNHCEVFRSETGDAYIKTLYNGNICSVNSSDFELCLRDFCFYQMDGTYPSTGASAQVAGHFCMISKKTKAKKIHRRICYWNNCVYYDIGLDNNRYYKISKDKIKVVKNNKLLFLKSDIQKMQVTPDLDVCPKDIPLYINKYFNFTSNEEKIVFATFLISCFFAEEINMPVINFYGEKASGKTFAEKRILDLINPTSTGILTMPKKIEDLKIALSSDYILAYDNVGWLNSEVSDLLCTNCHHTASAKRKLYTDADQKYLKLGAIVLFNSVQQCVTKSDLADRILAFHLNRICQEERIPENDLLADWNEDLPRFLGSLFCAVKGVLADESTAKYISPFRLSDYYKIAVKAGKQCGYSEDDVYWALDKNVKDMNASIIEDNYILNAVELFMKQEEMQDGYEATPEKFYVDLKIFTYETLFIGKFPGSPAALTKQLLNDKANLEMHNIIFEKGRHKERYVRLYFKK